MAEGARDEDEFGPYRIREMLGQGGMGRVHRAFDTRRERIVALKRLRTDLAQDAEFQERFRRESRLAARLSSPHCIPIHDFGEIDGTLFIDMRLIEGHDLGAELRDGVRIAPDRAVMIIEQIAEALTCAHRAGLVHRDVKPSNILLSGPTGRDFAYLVDFGVVRNVDAGTGSSLTGDGSAIGTLAYMAPEVLTDGRVDQRVDVYALACVLWQMLCGRKPFDAVGPALMYHHMHSPAPRVTSVAPDLPPAMDDVLLRGMSKDPSVRQPDADELARAARWALNTVQQPTWSAPAPIGGQQVPVGAPQGPIGGPQSQAGTMQAPIGMMSTGPMPPPPRRRRPGWVVALLTVLATLVLLGVAGGGYLLLSDALTPPDTTVLRQTFTDIAAKGAACGEISPEDAAGEAEIDVEPRAAIVCNVPETQARLIFVEWENAPDAAGYVSAVAAGRSSSTGGGPYWEIDKVRQGPLYIGPSGNTGFVTVGSYDDRRFGFVALAPSEDLSKKTFTDSDLPTKDKIPSG